MITTNIQGTAAVRRRLHKISPYLNKAELTKIAEYTRQQAYELAPKDTEVGARNIEVFVQDVSAQVVSPDKHMYVMEYGRGRNRPPPPFQALEGWGSRHGFVGYWALRMLAFSIGRKGIKPHRFMYNAAKAARAYVRTYTRDISMRIKKEWDDA